MRVRVHCPIPLDPPRGNAVTARRWLRIFQRLGHEAFLTTPPEEADGDPAGPPADVLVALHARRSAAVVEAFAAAHPSARIALVLTGTDLYQDLPGGDEAAAGALARAHRLVLLHHGGAQALPAEHRAKARVVLQSFRPPPGLTPAGDGELERRDGRLAALVPAHLRAVKDPLLPAAALSLLPAETPLDLCYVGEVLEPQLGRALELRAFRDPRIRLLGPRPRHETLSLLAGADLVVLPSRLEGGANALVEACVLGRPILATRIPGVTGLLGRDHEGLFAPGDGEALAALLGRSASDPDFRARLAARSRRQAPLFAPARETRALAALLTDLTRA